MAAKEMYDYLDVATPDYNVTLSLTPSVEMTEEHNIPDVEIHVGDDGSEERVLIGSGNSEFAINLMFNNETEADMGTLVDLFHTTGVGKLYSWKFDHPVDGHTYVTRFDSNLPRSIASPNLHSVRSVRLVVLGRIAD